MEYNERNGTYRAAPGAAGASLVATDKTPRATPEQQLIDAENAVAAAKTPQERETARKSLEQLRASIKDYATATEKPPTVIQQNSEVDRIAGRLGKPYETALTQAQGKMDRIDQTLHSVNAGYVGQGLAIPELLTALVSGQGTGVRITQPELNAITSARGIKGDFESWLNTIAGKGKLTDQDKAQIRAVLGDAKRRLADKMAIHNAALDSINGAETRAQVVEADKKARQQLNDLEKSGHYVGQGITLKDGKQVTVTAIHPDGSFDAN